MSAGVGNLIQANDYNTIQSTIAGVLGQNAAGYGQSLQSSQVATSNKVSAAQWNALQNDITAVNYHQLNVAPFYNANSYPGALQTAVTTTPGASQVQKIKDADRSAYLAVAQALASSSTSTVGGTSYPGCYVVPPTGQVTTPSASGQWVSTRTNSWGGRNSANYAGTSNEPTINHVIQLQWSNVAAAEYFFNAGSLITIQGSLSPSVTNPKNTSWQTLLSNMGTIQFSRSGTASSVGYGTGTSYGWAWFLANPNNQVTIYSAAMTGTYVPNQYDILCTYNGSGVLTFTAQFQDTSYGSASSSSLFFVDSDISGTTTSTVNMRYASGPYVSVSAYLPNPTTLTGLSS